MYERPSQHPADKGPRKNEEPAHTLREKVTKALKEQARMAPGGREAEHLGYMEE